MITEPPSADISSIQRVLAAALVAGVVLVAPPPTPEACPIPASIYQDQALAAWVTSFRALGKNRDRTPYQSRFLSRQPPDHPPTIDQAKAYAGALHGENKDPLSDYYIPRTWNEINAAAKLMNFPATPLLEEFHRLSPGDMDYTLIVIALERNYNLTLYPEILKAYEMEINPEKKKDLADILLHIQYNAILTSHINRRTWKDRYAALDERLFLAIRTLLKQYPGGLTIRDLAISNGLTTLRLAQRLEEEGLLDRVKIEACDKVMHFRMATHQGFTYFFNLEGELIQFVTPEGILWIRWTSAHYFQNFLSPVRWFYHMMMRLSGGVKVGLLGYREQVNFAEKNLFQDSRPVSLVSPEALAWASQYPEHLQFRESSIWDLSATKAHMILLLGFAMRPESRSLTEIFRLLRDRENYAPTRLLKIFQKTTSYLKKFQIQGILMHLGMTLHENGILINGIAVPPDLYVDIYREKRGSLMRLPSPQWSQGYNKSKGWDRIDHPEWKRAA